MDPHGLDIKRSKQGCSRCRLPENFCLCGELGQVEQETPLRILAHVREYRRSTNSAYYLPMVLSNVRFALRGAAWMDPISPEDLRVEGHEPLCLVADEEAELLGPALLEGLKRPPSLVLLDGTWHQVRRMYKRERALDGIRKVRLPVAAPSRWRVRKAPHPEALSSFEAVARALGILEGPRIEDPLMAAFDVLANRWVRVRTGQW